MKEDRLAIEAFPEPEFLEGGAPIGAERMLALFAHAGGIFTGVVVPAIVYWNRRKRSDFVVRHAREALNHQITFGIQILLLLGLGAGVTAILPIAGLHKMWSLIAACALTFILVVLTLIFATQSTIRACRAAWNGRDYRYPLTLRFIRR